MKMHSKTHSVKGAALAEGAAALTLMVPFIFLVIFVTVEVSQAFCIQSALAQGARRAARGLAIAYGQNPGVAGSRDLQEALVLDHVRLPTFINDNDQFDEAVFDTNTTPHTVSIKVRYLSGQYGLARFPHPDPLNVGPTLTLQADSTYRLE